MHQVMPLTSDVFKISIILIGIGLPYLLFGLWLVIKEGREIQNSLDCLDGGKLCPDYHEDLKALEEALDRCKCNHIRTIFTSFKDDP